MGSVIAKWLRIQAIVVGITLVCSTGSAQALNFFPSNQHSFQFVECFIKAVSNRLETTPTQRENARRLLKIRYDHLMYDVAPSEGAVLSPEAQEQRERIRYYIAVEAMTMIQERINIFNYASRSKTGRRLPQNLDDAFELQAGICGYQVHGFIDLVRHVGIQARSVQIYGTDDTGTPISHIAAEVLIGGKYRLFDITSETAFVSVTSKNEPPLYDELLSFEDFFSKSPDQVRCIRNSLNGWCLSISKETEMQDLSYFQRRPRISTSWNIGMVGAIRPLQLEKFGSGCRIRTNGIPNFLGRADDHGLPILDPRGVELSIDDPIHAADVEVHIEAVAIPASSHAFLQLRDAMSDETLDQRPIAAGKVVLHLPKSKSKSPRKLRLTIDSDDTKSTHQYATWNQIEVRYSSANAPSAVVYEARKTR